MVDGTAHDAKKVGDTRLFTYNEMQDLKLGLLPNTGTTTSAKNYDISSLGGCSHWFNI